MVIGFFIVIVLFAAILQTSTGFGFSIMATPFLLLLFEPKEAIQINLILSLVISAALITRVKNDMDPSIIKRFIIGSVPGLVLGIVLFLMVSDLVLKVGIGIAVLLLTLLLTLQFRIRRSQGRDVVVGSLSGALTTGIGMPGPPLLLYFAGSETNKEKLRATTLMFYLYIYSISLLIQVIFAGTTKTVWQSSVLALPLIVLGLYVGERLFAVIPQKAFQVLMYVLLVVTGILLIVLA